MKLLAAVTMLVPPVAFYCGIAASKAQTPFEAIAWMLGFACFWGAAIATGIILLNDFKK